MKSFSQYSEFELIFFLSFYYTVLLHYSTSPLSEVPQMNQFILPPPPIRAVNILIPLKERNFASNLFGAISGIQ